ncbi:MAG: sigma factor, partial [Acetatifactor sp.]
MLSHVLGAEETLFHISFSILRNEQDCADAVQEAILKAYSCLDKLRDEKYFKTWIVRILLNECYGITGVRYQDGTVITENSTVN